MRDQFLYALFIIFRNIYWYYNFCGIFIGLGLISADFYTLLCICLKCFCCPDPVVNFLKDRKLQPEWVEQEWKVIMINRVHLVLVRGQI